MAKRFIRVWVPVETAVAVDFVDYDNLSQEELFEKGVELALNKGASVSNHIVDDLVFDDPQMDEIEISEEDEN